MLVIKLGQQCMPVTTPPPPATQLRHDVENVTARLRYMSDAKGTVKDDIALTKRATEKTAADVAHVQEEKQKQACGSKCRYDTNSFITEIMPSLGSFPGPPYFEDPQLGGTNCSL